MDSPFPPIADDDQPAVPGSDVRPHAPAADVRPNGGGALYGLSGTAEMADSPRLVIRGENHSTEPNPSAAFIDWLNFTFPQTFSEEIALSRLNRQLVPAFGFGLGMPRNRGHLNYTDSWEIGRGFGIFASGGETVGGTSFFSLSGEGCHAVKDWQAVYGLLQELNARITRVDLAHDDFQGIRDIKLAVAWYVAGEFNSQRGRPPKAEYIDDFNSGSGKTLYVGSRESGKLLRVYEKGKQLGAPLHPWVRWELELHNKDRIVPLEVLITPGAYLATSYPCMAWVSDSQSRIQTIATTSRINLDSLLRHCRGSYGKLIWTLWQVLEIPPEEILAKLARPGIPPRLDMPVVGGGDV